MQGSVSTPLDDVSDAFTSETWPLGPMTSAWGITSTFQTPSGQGLGSYTLKFAVVDASGNPAMNLAISGKDITDVNAYSEYILGAITVQN